MRWMHFFVCLEIFGKFGSEEIRVSMLELNQVHSRNAVVVTGENKTQKYKQTNKQANSFTQRNRHIPKGNLILVLHTHRSRTGEKGRPWPVRDNEEITHLCVCVAFSCPFFLSLFVVVSTKAFTVDYFDTRQFGIHTHSAFV